jgi:hypothetical protein
MRPIPPELAADCEVSLAFRTDPGWQHVTGTHMGWGDSNFQVQPEVHEPAPVEPCDGTAGCLKVAYIDENGNQAWARFILADESLHRETAPSIWQAVLSDVASRAMVMGIRF